MSNGLRPSRKRHLIAVDDIGGFAALAFEHPEVYRGKALELGGDALTEQEVAETFSRVLARPVALIQPPANPDQPVSEELLLMWRWFDEKGYESDPTELRAIYPALQTLETWIRRTGWTQPAPQVADS
jgi:uncharacterized protein YbjT (DUF2867 family)